MYGIGDLCHHLLVSISISYQVADIEHTAIVKAGFSHALRGDTNTIARAAERTAIGCYNAYVTSVAWYLIVVRGGVGWVGQLGNVGV